MCLRLSFRQVFKKHFVSSNSKTATSTNTITKDTTSNVEYQPSIDSIIEVPTANVDPETTIIKKSKLKLALKKATKIIHKKNKEELLDKIQSNNCLPRYPEEDPYSSSDEEDYSSDEDDWSTVESESTFESLKKLSKVERFKRFFNLRKRKEPTYHITVTVTNTPLLGPGKSLAKGPIDISLFENPSQESLICEGNIKFKRNVECVVFKTEQIEDTQTSDSRYNLFKGKLSKSCFSKSFWLSHFSSGEPISSSNTTATTDDIGTTTADTGATDANTDTNCLFPTLTTDSLERKPILKSKNNINYELETKNCVQEDEKDTAEFFEYFNDKDNVETERDKRRSLMSLRRLDQLDNYYACNS
ncbi:uncharacterized protein SPAPADRAFT_68830 [Spathaspora passalidarum NRRL Y-27907]|uniref:Uncharacterized protein n=1 Tax=Spathaspora passalidarum (strain NRRL Y-27907 / 11-Y1) TaxID=619300 RepID=G3AVT8_SPAPN|nr:uncharacterized protein SPAPADRAFT_68830 [Spathaspora passalidarum NRRL Y-27907]EGW29983.1 hypothetical protein SPAPADRAFT_68830 [Spathaspora passalidarum NRRL Y-27907]